jgi:hypothetical protein
MAGNDVPTEDWDCDDDGDGTMGDQTNCGAGVGTGTTGTTGWKPEGQGRWTRAAAAQQTNACGPPSATIGAECAGGPAEGQTSGRGCQAGNDSGESPAKSRKCGGGDEAQTDARETADRQRALELLQQQRAAEEAQVASYSQGQGGFGSQAALSAAAKNFVLEVQKAEARAAKRGVEAKHADGRPLLELAPMELVEWIKAQLGDEDQQL